MEDKVNEPMDVQLAMLWDAKPFGWTNIVRLERKWIVPIDGANGLTKITLAKEIHVVFDVDCVVTIYQDDVAQSNEFLLPLGSSLELVDSLK